MPISVRHGKHATVRGIRSAERFVEVVSNKAQECHLAVRLHHADPDFEARFEALLGAKREVSVDVSQQGYAHGSMLNDQ